MAIRKYITDMNETEKSRKLGAKDIKPRKKKVEEPESDEERIERLTYGRDASDIRMHGLDEGGERFKGEDSKEKSMVQELRKWDEEGR